MVKTTKLYLLLLNHKVDRISISSNNSSTDCCCSCCCCYCCSICYSGNRL